MMMMIVMMMMMMMIYLKLMMLMKNMIMMMKHSSSTFVKICQDFHNLAFNSATDVTIWLMLNSHQIVTNQTLDEKPILSISS